MLGLLARRTDVQERRAASGVVELLLARRGGAARAS
jgi:hypothetical protein